MMSKRQGPPALAAGQRLDGGPLTVTQEQLWELDRRAPVAAALNLSYVLAINGPLDIGALVDAFRYLVQRHPSLRATYPAHDTSPRVEVNDEDLALRGLDLGPRQVRDLGEAALLACRDRTRAFDVAKDAPIRASLLRIEGRRHVLLLTLHHIAADGWSLHLLSRQLSQAYAARVKHQPFPQARQHGGCLEYARSQRAWLEGPAADQEFLWWADRLQEGATGRPPMLPSRRRSIYTQLLRQVILLPEWLTTELRSMGRAANASIFVLLLTALEVLIERWSGCDNALIGTLAASRPTPDSAYVLGAHYNTLLLNTDIGGDPPLAECLLRTAARTVGALDRQVLPYAVLADRLEREFSLDTRGLPSTMLLLDRYPLEGLQLEGCRVTGLYLDDSACLTTVEGDGAIATIPAATVADVTFFAREVGNRITLSAFYPSGLLDDSSVAAAIHGYVDVLAAICSSPELPLSELAIPFPELSPSTMARESAFSNPVLRDVTQMAPVEAISPVGRWNALAQ